MNQEQGQQTRRGVLGVDYVDHAIRNAGDFSRPMQELVTQLTSNSSCAPISRFTGSMPRWYICT